MKKIIKNLMYLGLFSMALIFNSCQEEFEEVNGGSDQETITASSTTASLIKNTSTKDGSFDNIVDGASCFAINFPYTVEVAGIQITIDSIEDLHLIEEIFDEFDDDEDILEIIFPITITLGDFTEITIENKEALRELIAECTEGDDDDIECIDFVYPITLFTFDVNEQQTGSVTINSDKELRRFFEGLEDDDLVSIDFPITLKKFDGTEVMVSNNAELAAALDAAKDECDEDDDNDYNDDDFSEERLDAYLVECPWLVRELKRDGTDQTDQYFEYLMNFTEDGAVTVRDREGNMLTGEWETSISDHGVVLDLEFEVLVDFNLQWLVYEVGEGRIKLFGDDNNKIILKQYCENDTNGEDPNTLREILKECEWIIKRVKNEGVEIDRLLGYEFKFMAEGVVTLSNGIMVSEGTWEVGLNAEMKLALLISFGDEQAVNFNWPLRELTNERLKFEVDGTDYELVLQRVCDDNAGDADVSEIRNIMLGGQWNVALYSEAEVDMTAAYNGVDFSFSNMHQVELSVNDDPFLTGLWRVLRNKDQELKFYLNFDEDGIYGDLTDDWDIVEVSADRIELRSVSGGDGSIDVLVFEKP
ncbi:hypothetical protein ACFSQJ_18980 [Croceitalea marina]|uniref:Lipocalin-like domain-containing protein n=1 Tax=Croceitalea marina TaxID=1775166 RepID=A0ABW5N1R4_9FLAO